MQPYEWEPKRMGRAIVEVVERGPSLEEQEASAREALKSRRLRRFAFRVLFFVAAALAAYLVMGCAKPKPIESPVMLNVIPGSEISHQSVTVPNPTPKLVYDKESTERIITLGEPAWIHWECPVGFHLNRESLRLPHHPLPTPDDQLPKCVGDGK